MNQLHACVMSFVAASCVAVNAAPVPSHPIPAPTNSTTPSAAQTAAARAKAALARKEAARHAALMLLAPADEYFGPLKQSILGIGNTIRDLGWRYDVNHDIGPQTIASAALTERAIRDWQTKYPRDHGVAFAIFRLQRLYARILTDQGQAKAQATATWLFASYGSSQPAEELHKVLAGEAIATPSANAAPQAPGFPPAAPDTAPSAPAIVNPLPSPMMSPPR